MESSVEELNIKIDIIIDEPYNGFEDTMRKQHEIEAIFNVKSSILMDMYNIEAKLDILHYVLGLEPYKYKHQ